MFGSKSGTVGMSSAKDPRWNYSIRLENISFSAGCPKELWDKVEEFKKTLGCEPPDDLRWGGMKD